MVNKKGYIRTIEAVIAIIVLLFATYAMTPRQISNPRATPYVVESAQEYAIDMIENDLTLRNTIINFDTSIPVSKDMIPQLKTVIENRLPAGYDFGYLVCDDPTCVSPTSVDTSMYMEDVIVSGFNTAENRNVVRLVRLWFWRPTA